MCRSANTQSSSKLGDPAEIFSDTVNIYSYFSPEWVFQMSAQIACLNRIIVTLAAFGGFFSRVSFQMPFQAISMKGCIVTLITFVTLFSRIKLQICPQTACLNRCIDDDILRMIMTIMMLMMILRMTMTIMMLMMALMGGCGNNAGADKRLPAAGKYRQAICST